MRFLFLILLCCHITIAHADGDTTMCTKADAMLAEDVAGTARSWEQLYFVFQKYGHCDDGSIGEGFSESVTLLLADRWREMPQLRVILKSTPAFRDFVIRHIDETVPAERLELIAENAHKHCPESLKTLCRDIGAATKVGR